LIKLLSCLLLIAFCHSLHLVSVHLFHKILRMVGESKSIRKSGSDLDFLQSFIDCGDPAFGFYKKVLRYLFISDSIRQSWPERAPQAPLCRQGQGAQYKMKLPCREAPPCLSRPNGMGGKLHFAAQYLFYFSNHHAKLRNGIFCIGRDRQAVHFVN
jgi:hypothetical protein